MILATLLLAFAAVPQATDQSRGSMPAGQPGSWLTNDDYPGASLRGGEMGTVQFELDIDARGRVMGCRVTGSSGYWNLDERVCAMMPRNASFKPALDATGAPIASTFKSRFIWAIPGKDDGTLPRAGGSGEPLELTLTVAQLPRAYQRPALLLLRFAVGSVAECKVEMSSGNARVDAAACAEARQAVQSPSAVPGKPAPDARTVTVAFQAELKAQ